MSSARASAYALSHMPNDEGIATCMWVYPGMSTSLYSSAFEISTSNSARTLCCNATSALRENSFMSTIT